MIGQTVSHYKILEHLGGGGMGVVYKAQDLKLDRLVALKFLPPELTRDPEAKDRFIHEAKTASALDHLNICVVHDIGETDDGQLFIVMAFYEGETLKKRIARGPLKVEEAVDIAVQVAHGLAKAHEHGIVHRDIKPANVMITSDGVVKVVDFGLAKLSGHSMLTKTGTTLGTAAYMSPEQAQGNIADERTDIWSLGVMLYEMIAGKRPFAAEYENALIYSILNAEPLPLAQYCGGIPPELERIISKCLKKSPESRYQSAVELLADLRDLTRSRETAPTPKKPRRMRLIAIGSAVGVTLLAIAAYLILRPTPLPTSEKSIAVLPFRNLSDDKEDEYFADGLTEDVIAQLARIPDIGKVIARTSVMQYKGIDRSIRDIGRELDVAAVLEGSYRRSGSQVRVVAQLINAESNDHLWAETYDRNLTQIFELQSELAHEIASALEARYSLDQGNRPTTTRTKSSKAYKLYLMGRHFWNRRDTEANLRKSIEYFNQALDEDPLYADAYCGLAIAYAVLCGWASVPIEEVQPRVYSAARRALELDPTLPEAHAAVGFFACWYAGNWHDGKRELERAVALSPNDVTSNHWYSHYLTCVGRFDEGIDRIKKALALDPISRDLTICEGDANYYARKYDQAIAVYQRALALDSTNADAHAGIAQCYVAKDMYDKAFEHWQVLDRRAADDCWNAYKKVGIRAMWLKKLAQASDSLRILTDQVETVGEIYSRLGMNDQAFEWLERCRENHIPLRFVKVSPGYDNIRGDPRFALFLKKVGLEE